MSKIVTLAAAATGYVLGARAGQERYQQIAGQAQRFWHDPRVRKAAADAKHTAAEKAPVVKDKIAETAGNVADRATGGSDGSDTPTQG
jgi:hypothetical protein